MDFTLGQIFVGDYPEEAACFCNDNNYIMNLIEPTEDGERQFRIEEAPELSDEEKHSLKLAQATSLEARISAIEDMLAEIYGD